jgi:hypothetical protein
MAEVKWQVLDIQPMFEFGTVVGSKIYIAFIGPHSGNTRLEYIVMVEKDGTWMCLKADGSRWRETNGVCEEAEPVFKAALPKAQALAILKG